MSQDITLEYPIKGMDFVSAGEASSNIKHTLQLIGFSPAIIRRAAIAAYEAEMNIVIHGSGGVLKTVITPEKIELTAEDSGPGIPDIDLAMQEGYSTAPDHIREMGFGAGMGLPNIRNCSDEFVIDSQVGKGTIVKAVIYRT
ncbi:MAG: anti-sigma regulatory factor [Firmicutes bacterium HGW-Firmicutes-14]|jgi:anti-sigma regulatory factor (Ser/Thr protein kinase)|nr:MAG: anti-sigma regulatory factor [Firmicutes bacterium HGW-Firmicutes-14]